MRRARSVMASLAGPIHTGGTNRKLNSRPTAAPISVSSTRSQAVSVTLVTPSTSIALIATSGTNSPAFTSGPMMSETRMISPRLHQVRPTSALKPIASSTPATTELTRRIPVVSVE